jgi:sirohydrochlorin ferrochelatase
MDSPRQPPLVVVAHGSRDDRSAAAVGRLVDAVRRQRPGIRIQQGFLDFSRPRVADVLDALQGEIVVLPLLLTPAYHSRVDLPGVLAAHQDGRKLAGRTPLDLRYGATLGPHDTLVSGMVRRLAEAGVQTGDPDVALVLAAAGSSNPCGTALVRGVARRWAADGWWDVVPAFASATGPTVAEAVAGLRARGAPRVIVASYFLAPGRLPDRVVRGAGDCVVAAPLDDAPEVAELVLTRYDEALAPGGGSAGTARCDVLGDAARARCGLCRARPQ